MNSFLLLLMFCQKNATTQGLAKTSAFDDEPEYMVKFIEMVWVVQKNRQIELKDVDKRAAPLSLRVQKVRHIKEGM